jgi:hypothetical protein
MGSISRLGGTVAGCLWRAHIATNDRETGKNYKCAAIMIVFRRNPGVVCAIKRGPYRVSCAIGHTGLRGPEFVWIFDPAETT